MANERPESCYKTCFTLQHKGKVLDEFAVVHTVETMVDGETIKCVAGINITLYILQSCCSRSKNYLTTYSFSFVSEATDPGMGRARGRDF